MEPMDDTQRAITRALVWWKPPEEVAFIYLVRRIMELGTPDMIGWLRRRHGEPVMREALDTAEPGSFSARSWNYWHVFYGVRPTPPLPRRAVPDSPYVSPEIGRASAGPAGALAEPR
jgi:hypothetical protein